MRLNSNKTRSGFLAILLLLLLANAKYLPAQQLKFELYFPAKTGITQEYTARRIMGNDTMYFENPVLTFRETTAEKKKFFYLEEKKDTGSGTIIGSNVFCFGVFRYEKGVFYQAPLFWKSELEKARLQSFKLLFPATVKIGSAYKIKHNEETRTYRFTGFENLSFNHTVWENCLKLEIIQDWPSAHYTDYVWFKKGVGVVRWLRSTGRLVELVPEAVK